MKNILFLIAIIISTGCFSQSKDEMAIRKILNDQTAAWNNGDVVSFMQGYWKNDSLMFIGKAGITWGWEKTLQNYKKAYPDTTAMGKLSFDIPVVKRISKEYFYIVGKWKLQRTIGDLGGHFTLVFKKIRGEWLIISDHSS